MRKEYLALAHGKVEPEEGTINVPLGRSRFDRQKFAVTPGGRISETSYQIASRLTNNGLRFTLLRLFPKTGRTHQIRVHLKYFGHPIVADEKYGGEKRAKLDKTWCPRLVLHAAKITFFHPITKREITIEAELPKKLNELISRLSTN